MIYTSDMVDNMRKLNPSFDDKGIHIITSPMGSGKTYTIKHSLLERYSNTLVSAPYKSSRLDFGYEVSKGSSLSDDFLYTGQLIQNFADHAMLNTFVNKPSLERLKPLMDTWVKANIDTLQDKTIILDEVDFMWIQASMTFITLGSGDKVKAGYFWEELLYALGKVCRIYGLTASTIPSDSFKCRDYSVGGHTSVRINSMTTNLYNNTPIHEVLESGLQEAIDSKRCPTLVYKRRYSEKDIQSIINLFRPLDYKILVVTRKELLPVRKDKELWDRSIVRDNFMNIRADDVNLETSNLHFLAAEGDTSSLDSALPSGDVFTGYDFVFITTSSSRQVSLKDQNTNTCRVICFGSGLDRTMIQVAGRFRKNPVEMINHFIGLTKSSVDLYTGDAGAQHFCKFDPHINFYKLKSENINGVYRGNLKRKASPTTQRKKELLQDFITKNRDGTINFRFELYCAWIKKNHPDTKPYSIKPFYKVCKEQAHII